MPTDAISSLPKRKLLLQDAVPEFDVHGFFSATPETETFDAFWEHELLLVLGPPWMGKTFVSQQLKRHLDRISQIPSENPFGMFIHRTDFEHESHEEILPSWWQEWIGSDARACWIIDAVDEDGRTGSKKTHRILNTWGKLTPEKRAKLCCFMFARENELPKQIEKRLGEIYGQPEPEKGRYAVVRLAPLDADMALDYLGSKEAFERVCTIIGDNGLQSVAGYPSALDRLARQQRGVQLNDVTVWKEVLHELIRDKRAESSRTQARSSPALQFEAAARIAVILTFSDCDAVRETDIYGDGPSIDSFIPQEHFKSQMLNAAARDVLRSSVFRRTIRGFQFAQHHVQQWFAAFGVSDLSLNRLRPLLTDHDGKLLDVHNGVMGLLTRTTARKAVKDWIVEQHGGIAPRPDAAPWNLTESLFALDRLQSIAKTTPWGLSLWNDRGLTFLAVPHLGPELVKRLANRSLDHTERELIVDVALATRAKEIIPTAITVAFNHSEDSRLRESAAALVMAIGDKANWLAFADEASKNNADDKLFNTMKATVAAKLYYEHIWDFDTTVRASPAGDPRSRTLFYRLEKDMTVDDARRFLQSADIDRLSSELQNARGDRQFRWAQLGIKAIELVAKQPHLLPSDYNLLLPIVLEQHRREWGYYDDLGLLNVIAADRDARRALLHSIINEPTEVSHRAPWQVRSLIAPEDLLWLTPIAEAEQDRHPWIWRCILEAALWNGVETEIREQVHAIGHDKVPALLQEVKDEQARAIRDEQERQNEERELRKQQTPEIFSMVDLIDQALSSSSISPCDKMRHLTWVCLTGESERPTNVIGKWEDIDDERRQSVLDICRRALVDCDPTDIPTANSYSMPIVYEAYCFAKLSEDPPPGYAVDATQVTKWLQSALAISVSQDDATLARCHSKEPAAAEAVLIKEIRRCLSIQPNSVFWLESLPPTAWTPSFCETLATIADDEHYAIQGRAGLLQTLFVYGNGHAMSVLMKWLQAPTVEQRRAAVDLLILKYPELIWDEFARQVASDGKDTLLHMRSLSGHHNVPPALSFWNATFIEQLHAFLMQFFPPDKDPKREPGVAYGYGTEDSCRDLRRGLAPLLLSRGTADDLAALDRMASSFPPTGIWYAQVKAEKEAASLLSELLPKPAAPKRATIPFPKIVRLLDVSLYRLIRNAGDLQEALLEQLAQISSDAQEHLSCLYYPRKAQKQQRKTQQNLQEDALQAYLYCRLTDRLKDRVLDAEMKIVLNREPLSTKDQRVDIKIQSLTLAGELATVIIELKWSNNSNVSTSLAKQLGEQYLVAASLTHGIYLVAWNIPGTWRDKTVARPTNRHSLDAWRAAFSAQAQAFSASNATVVIAPLVVDLAWPPSAPVPNKKARKRTSKPKASSRNLRSKVSKPKRASSRSTGTGRR